MKAHAYAKVNLTLEVLGRRPDGYHEIKSVLQTIELADTLIFELAKDLRLFCRPQSLATEDNLVLQAARLLKDYAVYPEGAAITLEKGIPEAAGLGGGSSDAATTLRGLCTLWGLDLPSARLKELATQLGSDVPFFLAGGTALAEGRGEKVHPLPPLPEAWLVLLRPPIEMPHKTARLYASLGPQHYTSGERTRRLVEAIEAGRPPNASLLFNVFEVVAYDVFPGLADYRRRFREAGAPTVHLAGSGPTLFCPVEDEAQGAAIYRRLGEQRLEAYLARTTSAALRWC